MAKLAVWSWLATVDLRGPTKRQLSVGSAVRHPFLCATWPIGPSHKWPEWPVQRGVPGPLLLGQWGDHDIKMQAVPTKQGKKDDWINWWFNIMISTWWSYSWGYEWLRLIFHFGPHEPWSLMIYWPCLSVQKYPDCNDWQKDQGVFEVLLWLVSQCSPLNSELHKSWEPISPLSKKVTLHGEFSWYGENPN